MKNTSTSIHHLSSIHPGAQIGENVEIGPFVTISEDVVIGDGTWIGPNAVIDSGARIGKNCNIFPGAVISAVPMDRKFAGEYTTTEIGDNTIIRQYSSINRGTEASGKTIVGSNVLIMAYVQIAHDCVVNDNAIIANACNLGGHVNIEEFAIIGGMSAIHQFCNIGKHCILAGGSLVGKDVPPFTKAAWYPIRYAGVNKIGLQRNGFTKDTIHEIHEIYRTLYMSGLNTTQALKVLEKDFPPSPHLEEILNFIQNSQRGIMRGYTSGSRNE